LPSVSLVIKLTCDLLLSQVGENEPYHLKPSPDNTTTPVLPHQPTSQCAAYESSVRISVIRGGGGKRTSPPPHQPIFTVSLIFLELFQDLLENPDTAAADTRGSKFELNSHLVTIALETAEDETPAAAGDTDGRRRVFYSPADTLALDGSFLFSLEFVFLNGSFNWTERRLACGEVTPPAAGTTDRGVGDEENPPALRVSPHCYLAYDNVTADAAPRCVCNRSGTYGLLIPRLQRWEPGVPVRGVSKVCGPVRGVSKVAVPVSDVSKIGGQSVVSPWLVARA
jgi:hypothetical protein